LAIQTREKISIDRDFAIGTRGRCTRNDRAK